MCDYTHTQHSQSGAWSLVRVSHSLMLLNYTAVTSLKSNNKLYHLWGPFISNIRKMKRICWCPSDISQICKTCHACQRRIMDSWSSSSVLLLKVKYNCKYLFQSCANTSRDMRSDIGLLYQTLLNILQHCHILNFGSKLSWQFVVIQ